MSRHHANRGGRILLAGTAVSLVVHLAIGAGFVRLAASSPAPAAAQDTLARVEIFLPPEPPEQDAAANDDPQPDPPPPPPQEVRLGIDDGAPDAKAWLGFSEATEHAARLASIDQSAMTLSASDGRGESHTASAPAPAEPQPTPPQPTEPESADMDAAAQRLAETLRDAIRLAADAATELTAELKPPAAPQPTSPSTPQRTQQLDPGKTTDAPSPGDSAPHSPGIAAERESVASSIRRAPMVRPGSVLAAEGLEIRTRAPRWSLVTTMMRRPRNPTVEIIFGADGRVRRAGFASDGIHTYSTGFDDVDEPLLSAIYTWTARGKPIEELARKQRENETTPAEIRILLTIMLN